MQTKERIICIENCRHRIHLKIAQRGGNLEHILKTIALKDIIQKWVC